MEVSQHPMDANERSDTTRVGIANNLISCPEHMISYISNEDGINSIFITLMSALTSTPRQKSSSSLVSYPLLTPYAFIGIALFCHGDHNGMTVFQPLITAYEETHMLNCLWLMLINLCMIPPQKQLSPKTQSFVYDNHLLAFAFPD